MLNTVQLNSKQTIDASPHDDGSALEAPRAQGKAIGAAQELVFLTLKKFSGFRGFEPLLLFAIKAS